MSDMQTGLTDEETRVAGFLIDAWVEFGKLVSQHPDENRDFTDAIHRCQSILALRIVRRLYPKGWPTHE